MKERADMKIGFIGMGNMASAILGGLLEKHMTEAGRVTASAKTADTLAVASARFGVRTTHDNREVAASSDVLFLCVKPVFLSDIIGEIKDSVPEHTVVVSIAAGRTIAWMEEAFGGPVKLIRCMPNTPALVGAGCTAMCGNGKITSEEENLVFAMLSSFGMAVRVPERLMDAVGAVSGSSPAYVFMFIEAMADGAVAAGMPRKQAYEMAAQAVLGSARMVLETGKHPGELKDMVCSPGGTTIEAVRVLEERGMRGAVMDAMAACMEKTKKL